MKVLEIICISAIILPLGLVAQNQLNPIEKCVVHNLTEVGINYDLIVDSLYIDLTNSGIMISFQNSRVTPYKTYLRVYNSLKDCLHEVRKKKSMELFGENFDKLDEEKQKYIRESVVLKITEQLPN